MLFSVYATGVNGVACRMGNGAVIAGAFVDGWLLQAGDCLLSHVFALITLGWFDFRPVPRVPHLFFHAAKACRKL